MNKDARNKGITLIALVITIIILLILAAISIRALTGENGLIAQVQRAKKETEEAKKKENQTLGDYEDIFGEVVGEDVPKPDEPDLGDHKGIESDWIPIYTIENYKKIATEEQNYAISDLSGNFVGNYNMNKDAKYRLMNDIDFTSEANIATIKGFKGIFDGNGYYIKNISIDTTGSADVYYYKKGDAVISSTSSDKQIAPPAGMFDRIENGTIENLGVDNATVLGAKKTIDTSVSGASTGVIAGEIIGTTINNCIIKNSTITSDGVTNSGSVGALVGWAYKSDAQNTITKVKVDNTKVKGASVTSGLVGVATGPISITGCLVENSEVNMQATSTSTFECQGGILGYSYSITNTIDNCYIGNVNFKNNIENNSSLYNSCGGILGGTYEYDNKTNEDQNINITNCSVENVEQPYARNSGGILGKSGGWSAADGIKVNILKCIINDLKAAGREVGGILGSTANTDLSILECNVINFKASEKNIGYDAIQRGGIIGSIITDSNNNNIIVAKCNVKNSEITADTQKSGTNIGGIVGAVYGNSVNYNDSKIDSCRLINTKVKDKITSSNKSYNHNIGGIVGEACSIDISNCDVNKSNIIMESDIGGIVGLNNNNGNASGIVGNDFCWIYDKVSKIYNCNVRNTEVTNNYFKAHGIGNAHCYNAGAEFKNCNVDNCKITGYYLSSGISGSSLTRSNEIIDTCSVINSEIISNVKSAGGISGELPDRSAIVNCKVEKCKVKNLNGQEEFYGVKQGSVGGILGYTQNVTITECEVNDTEIENHNDSTGGILGSCYTVTNLSDCVVKNSTITSERNNVGGIVGGAFSEDKIANCTVENVNIIAKLENVGGIIGLVIGLNVTDCKINNLSIKSEANNIGGIVGCISNSSTRKISNCNIENSTLEYKGNFVGEIYGFKSDEATVENCNATSTTMTKTT